MFNLQFVFSASMLFLYPTFYIVLYNSCKIFICVLHLDNSLFRIAMYLYFIYLCIYLKRNLLNLLILHMVYGSYIRSQPDSYINSFIHFFFVSLFFPGMNLEWYLITLNSLWLHDTIIEFYFLIFIINRVVMKNNKFLYIIRWYILFFKFVLLSWKRF